MHEELIDELEAKQQLSRKEWILLLNSVNDPLREYAASKARSVAQKIYGTKIYVRGLIEFTNYCRNDCYYCGIRRSNSKVNRYRLTPDEIISCCDRGYQLGFHTFVLQGGEDLSYTDEALTDIIRRIKAAHPDCALTLSIGERERSSYQKFYSAGADRFLLRHETADDEHYNKLHPKELSPAHRKQCLSYLKEIGYQTGCGIMVGSPYQTTENIADDLLYMKELDPQMVGIGPFIPHTDTPFKDFTAGSLEMTLFLLSLTRLMLPNVLLPATTALGTIKSDGRELGVLAGANVIMPNLSPGKVKKDYILYDNKICTGEEAAECISCVEMRMQKIGYQIAYERGDYKKA